MNKFLWLLISVCGSVTGLLANEKVVNANNEIIEQLGAQRVPEDYFTNKPDIIFLDSTRAAVLYPQFYPNVVAILAQALSTFNRDTALYDVDRAEDIKAQIAVLQWKLAFWESKGDQELAKQLPFPMSGKTAEQEIQEARLQSEEIKKWRTKNEQIIEQMNEEQKKNGKQSPKLAELATEREKYVTQISDINNDLSLEIARRHILQPSFPFDREQAKKIERLNATIYLRRLGVSRNEADNAAPAFIISFYGKWNTPNEVCQAIDNFLTSRGVNYRCRYFAERKITAQKISALLKNKLPIALELAINNQSNAYVCIVGIDEPAGDVFTGFIPPKGMQPDVATVERCDPDMVCRVKWETIKDKVCGYYVFEEVKVKDKK